MKLTDKANVEENKIMYFIICGCNVDLCAESGK